MKECIFCQRMRSEKYMQEAVFRGISVAFDLPAGVWACSNRTTCKNERRLCPKCGHRKSWHEYTDNWFGGVSGTYCMTNMGMGDPCGCEEYNE